MDIEKLFECIKEIENGKTIEEVAERINIKPERLKAELLYHGGKKGKNILLKEITDQFLISIDELICEFQKGKTTGQIAEEHGVEPMWFIDMLKKYESISGEKLQGRNNWNIKRKDLDNEQIGEGYRNGESISKLALKYNASITAIQDRITWYIEKHGKGIVEEHKRNLKARRVENFSKTYEKSSEENKKIESKTKEEERVLLIKKMINQGYSYEEICEKYGKIPKVYYYIALNDIDKEQEGEQK